MTLGHVHLKVRNLKRSIEFYQTVFNLSLTENVGSFAFLTDGGPHHSLALQEVGPNAPPSPTHGVGLYHVAFEVPTDKAFAETLVRLQDLGIEPTAVDHGISWAMYFNDPDGLGLEIYVDRRKAQGVDSWHGSRRLNPQQLRSLLTD